MKHIPLKKNKHLILFEVNADLPTAFLEQLNATMKEEFPKEFKFIISQSEATVLTIEDDLADLLK